ncbi:hypothetical protein [Nostoc flagelliforme]
MHVIMFGLDLLVGVSFEGRSQIDRIWQYLREQRGNGQGEG